jgi:hypothetical protein
MSNPNSMALLLILENILKECKYIKHWKIARSNIPATQVSYMLIQIFTFGVGFRLFG